MSLIVLAAVLWIGRPGLAAAGADALCWSLLAALLAGGFFLLTGSASNADPASEGEACGHDGGEAGSGADGDGSD